MTYKYSIIRRYTDEYRTRLGLQSWYLWMDDQYIVDGVALSYKRAMDLLRCLRQHSDPAKVVYELMVNKGWGCKTVQII